MNEYLPSSSSAWYCPRYVKALGGTIPTTPNAMGYFYWAYDVSGATMYEIETGAVSNRWMGKGLCTNMVLVSDRFAGLPLNSSLDTQYHAGKSTSVGLDQMGTHVLLSGGSTLRVSPRRGVIK